MLLLVRPHRASALLWVGSVLWICGGSAAIALGSSPSALTAPAFADLLPSLPPAVAASLAARGIRTPTPIQAAALPRIAAGESVLLHAETGSGKSLAFLLPSLTRCRLPPAPAPPPTTHPPEPPLTPPPSFPPL